MKIINFLDTKVWAGLLGFLVVLVFFIGASFIASMYQTEIQLLIGAGGVWSMFTYICITAVAIVVAPVSTLPLMPIATSAWGWPLAGALSVVGWVLGSQIAFALARRYGKRLVQRFVSLEALAKFENSFKEKNLFWLIIFLRMTVPVDVLSYGLGLFSSISGKLFFLATLIGVIPFAFIFAYTGGLPPGMQIITLIEVALFLGMVYLLRIQWKKHFEVPKSKL